MGWLTTNVSMKILSIKPADTILALFVVAIAALLLLPLPTYVLDLLIALNLGSALVLLLLALYVPSALSLLSFPTILLLTTLFRLGLDVASTRLILTQGFAGKVIDAFGNVLVRGDVVVGLVLFFIITVVHFLVVAKGSARVSEVAARFALDALPGKQMAIDADLRAGLLTPEEAKQKRDDLRKESQLYGAMDGAMKFVQGDAIAGIIIIVINIIGGVIRGVVSRGLSFSDAISTYTILTVGDGLVHQVPAILISVCAGLVVTRISSSDTSTLGTDVGVQLGAKPGVLMFAGAVLCCLGIFTPLPFMAFVSIGLILVGLGYWKTRIDHDSGGPKKATRAGEKHQLVKVSEEDRFFSDEDIRLVVGSGLLKRFTSTEEGGIRATVDNIRQEFFDVTGVFMPQVLVKEDPSMGHYGAIVYFGSTAVKKFDFHGESIAILVGSGTSAQHSFGFVPRQEFCHPLSGATTILVDDTTSHRKIAEGAQLTVWNELELVIIQALAWLLSNPQEILNAAAVHQRMRAIENKYPGYISEGVGEKILSISALTSVLQRLIHERCSLKDMRAIIEIVSKYCTVHGIGPREQGEIVIDDVVDFVYAERPRLWWAPRVLYTSQGGIDP